MQPTTVDGDDAVDLQIHTIHSDGTWVPDQLFAYLASARFRVVAVTDHDHMNHIDENLAVGHHHGITVVPAVEATTDWHGQLAHVLCFANSFIGTALAEVVHATETLQRENTAKVYETLQDRGFALGRPSDRRQDQQARPARPIDNAHLLVTRGYAPAIDVALDMIRDAGFRSITADLATVVKAAHASGGVALISHPGRREPGFVDYDCARLDELRREVPIDGIEVRHPSHTSEQVMLYEQYARETGLLRGAGSDSHGPLQRLPIPYHAGDVFELLDRCGVHVTL